MSRLLALDQSSTVTGWAIFIEGELKDWGHLTTNMSDIGDRLVQIRNFILNKFDEWDIDTVAFEDIQLQTNVGRHAQTVKALANVYGVVYETAIEFNKKYMIIPSVTWKSKLNIKGRQRAEQKRNAQQYVKDNYNIKPTQDEADAVCIGICANILENEEKGHDWSN